MLRSRSVVSMGVMATAAACALLVSTPAVAAASAPDSVGMRPACVHCWQDPDVVGVPIPTTGWTVDILIAL